MKIDKIDKRILEILQSDAYITNVELASRVGISPPAMLERVKRLEKSSVIKKYVALVDNNKIGKGTIALVSVSLTAHQLSSIDSFTAAIEKLDDVLECHHVSGDHDFLLKVCVKDIQAYEKFILEKLTRIKGVDRIKTTFVLSSVKNSTKIPVEQI
ncbi:MAG: Lrp/AsnC family transcriptional regulator [Ignavibacteriales bacterium]|nr:MAG: Lrp/AsnC family transcriptional regulator [Ignavibacteriales bacterium]